MIKIKDQLCYSPRPPEAYGFGPLGHGPMCKGDIQLWNLMFLSYPRIDGYLTVPSEVGKVEFYRSFSVNTIAMPRAALFGQANSRIFPDLRDALRRAPHLFLEDLWRMQWHMLPMQLEDPTWTDTIQVRARELDADQRTERIAAITHREGNIVNVKFGR